MTTAGPPTRPGGLVACEVRRPASLAEALDALRELGPDGAPLAGGTWIMRAPLRHDPLARVYVALSGIEELAGIASAEDEVSIGALVTHAELAAVNGSPALAGLARAAERSAFPAVRSVATVGGNLAAVGFPEADLVPALLAADARIELEGPGGRTDEDVATYLGSRGTRPAGELITRVVVPTPPGRRSAFERLTIRGGGEYAVASVAVSLTVDDAGVVSDARVAVGSVEEQARLSAAAAAVLVGSPPAATTAQDAGAAAAEECAGRDGLDAPGWYRLTVLPSLLRTAVAGLIEEEH